MDEEAADRDGGDRDLDEFQPLRDHRLVEAIGDFSAQRREEKYGAMKIAPASVDQRLRPAIRSTAPAPA